MRIIIQRGKKRPYPKDVAVSEPVTSLVPSVVAADTRLRRSKDS